MTWLDDKAVEEISKDTEKLYQIKTIVDDAWNNKSHGAYYFLISLHGNAIANILGYDTDFPPDSTDTNPLPEFFEKLGLDYPSRDKHKERSN